MFKLVDSNTISNSTYPPDPDLSATIKDISQCASRPLYFTFAITLRTPEPSPAAPKVIGRVGGTKLPEIGYGFNEAYWGKGYASEALEGFLKMYWERFPQGFPGMEGRDRHLLKATTNPRNKASRRVLAKAGFREVGEIESNDYMFTRKISLDGWVIERPERKAISEKTENS